MTRRVFLHVGPMKTGSTYLQECLRGAREELAGRGVLLPVVAGRGQQRAVIDLLARKSERRSTVPAAGAWQQAVAEIQQWSGDAAIVSGEALAAARADTVTRAVETLQPAELHIVATMRSLAQLIPSYWQSNLRNRKSVTWPQYRESLRGESADQPQYGNRFWRTMDVSSVLRLWADVLPADRLHVVVMPPKDAPARELWDRFCAALGIEDPPDPVTETPTNIAIGTEQAEALRRLNAGLAGQYPDHLYARFVKQIATPLAVRTATDIRRMALPPEDFDWVRDQSQRIVDEVIALGCHVVGEPSDAVPSAPVLLTPYGPFRPDDYRPEKVADTATNIALALLAYLRSDDRHPAGGADDDVTLDHAAGLDEDDDQASGTAGALVDSDAVTIDDLMARKREKRQARRQARRAAR